MPFSDETTALLERFRARDTDDIADAGRTKLLLHGEVRPLAVVLFHGMSANPRQFHRFAHDLHALGHNVVVPRLPRHGRRARLTDVLALLSAHDLRAFAQSSIELAQGLGERVVVAGFSLGGLLTTWVAQRYPLERAVAIAPFFGMSWMPTRYNAPFARTLLKVPNFYSFGFPSHGLAEGLLWAREVYAHPAVAARELIFVTNASEAAVSNRAVRRLLERLEPMPEGRIAHVELGDLPPSHDIIEPFSRPELADRVYPTLLGIITQPR
jgi:alpha-beta hydrolase superfamily lysophospholipase